MRAADIQLVRTEKDRDLEVDEDGKDGFRGWLSVGPLIDNDFGDRLRNTSHFQARENRYGR